MPAEALIIDGYVGEPACLGVPPYISPYIRYIAGVLREHDREVRYLTIDQIRDDPGLLKSSGDGGLAVMVAGVTVPGKYLGGSPATLTEIQQLGTMLRGRERLLCGPIAYGYAQQGGRKAIRQEVPDFDQLLTGSPAEALDNYLSLGQTHGKADYLRSDPWSVSGAAIIRQHPNYPHVMIETETGRGCPRGDTGGCSFCTEPSPDPLDTGASRELPMRYGPSPSPGPATFAWAGSLISLCTAQGKESSLFPARNSLTSSSGKSGR